MKVVLSTPPGKTTELWPPLGLLYVAASNRSKRTDDIRVIDAFCENLDEGELVAQVAREKPDVFGINCSTHTFMSAVAALRKIREKLPEAKLVLGGFHATFAGERILREYPFLDYIVKGEAEKSFPKLLECVERGTPPTEVEGIGFVDGGKVISNDPILIDDLDSLPFPARELAAKVNYGYFHKSIRLTFGKFTTVSSSRGCPYRCAYCSCAAFSQRKWRPRSPENVVDELEHLYGDGYECCVFVDDNLTHSSKRIERICDLIRSRRIKMQYYCEGRVDNASLDLMKRMKRAGFTVMYFGVESAQKHVLDYYRKAITAEQSLRAIENAKEAGMIVVTSYIMGAPVESIADMMKTVDFIREARHHALQVNILDCLIGTEIWERLEKEGRIAPGDWKTNHRIYEYTQDGMSKSALEDMVNRGYSAHLEAWKNRAGIREILEVLLANKTARTVVLKNLLNRDARKRLIDGRRYGSAGQR